MPRDISIEDLLSGVSFGRRQSVGPMEVIPILGDDNEDFAPPDVAVGTSDYGTVVLTNESELPTITPVGAGWVVQQAAQDHAIGGGALLAPGQSRKIDTAACIQQSQGGYISKKRHDLLVLPVALRPQALATRKEGGYNKLWSSITDFNRSVGISRSGGHLEYFLDAHKKALDEFVAEFEVVPNMLGAVVLVGGTVVGVELGPNAAYWAYVWRPLIRVCYGSLAIQVEKRKKSVPQTRVPFTSKATTIDGLLKSLRSTTAKEQAITDGIVTSVLGSSLRLAAAADERMKSYHLMAVASQRLAGQVVYKDDLKHTAYVSVCAASPTAIRS